jgi:hypothetical protein
MNNFAAQSKKTASAVSGPPFLAKTAGYGYSVQPVLRVIALDKIVPCGDGSPRACRSIAAIIAGVFIFLTTPANAAGRQFVQGHLPAVIANQQPIGRVPASTRLDLAFGLPLRHPQDLTNLLRQIYQPGSPAFRHYLTPGQFAAAFGPTEADYQSVIDFAMAHGLTVTGTHPNRTLVDVNGAVGDIERALHVHMNLYRHPTENRTFYAPDAQPSIDLETSVLVIGGLHNYTLPHPCVHPVTAVPSGRNQPQAGSGPDNTYLGGDFPAAYASGVSLNGAGQAVGVFELEGYDTNSITTYEGLASITPSVPLTNILIDGYSGAYTNDGVNLEVCLDIEMAIAMAPGLANVMVYEGNPGVNTVGNDVLNRMATDNQAKQLSSSYLFDINVSTDQIFQQFAAQGQSFFQSSGDYDAYSGPVLEPADDPNITVVGGTFLSTSGPLGSWVSESTWNVGGSTGSGGGISVVIPIPFWQQGIDMSTNQGSTTLRNLPDVSMLGYDAWVQYSGGGVAVQGTSIAAPLWAGFTALVNQQAALNGQPQLGFANPSLYAIGKSTNYTACFHDITTGNNTSSASPSNFYAVAGYDLCTGWGTPIGSNLIAALLSPQDALVITPQLGFTATGPVGGPFDVTSQSYWLTNAGNVPLNWTLANTSLWLSVSSTGGTLLPGGPGAAVTVALNSVASNLLMGDFSGTISFTNLQDNVPQSWPIALLVGNGGFETGDFSDWSVSGDSNACAVIFIDGNEFPGAVDPIPGVTSAQFVHSGRCGAFLGQIGSLGSLSQSLPTVAAQYYLLSCWLSSLAENGSTTPNEFQINWNGTTLFDQTNMGAFGWTNLQFLVAATGSATPLEFAFRDDPAALALDDVTLQAVSAPVFQTVTQSGGVVSFAWNALPGLTYQLQYTTNLDAANWANLGAAITAATNVVTAVDTNPLDPQRFYRFVVSP